MKKSYIFAAPSQRNISMDLRTLATKFCRCYCFKSQYCLYNFLLSSPFMQNRFQRVQIFYMENCENCDNYGLTHLKKMRDSQQKKAMPYLSDIFQYNPHTDQAIVRVTLLDDILKMQYPQKEIKIPLTFWMIFYTIEDENLGKLGFKIKITQNETYFFYCSSKNVLRKWKFALSNHILIWGFYEDYKPLAKIGKGKSASVFLAIQRKDNQKVAVKAFPKNQIQTENRGLEGFQNQIRILRSISNPCLLKYIATYETQKSYYLISEYVEGQTLKSFLQHSTLTYQESKNILRKIATGLKYLAKRDIAHRDLKPENIVIENKTLKPYIIDFGLATFCKERHYIYKHCGTPGYVAPQILNGCNKQITPLVDMFSLGIIYHLLLLNKFPYTSRDIHTILKQNKEAQFNFQYYQYTNLPEQGVKILQELLDPNPTSRISAKRLLSKISAKKYRQKSLLKQLILDGGAQMKRNDSNSPKIQWDRSYSNRIQILRCGSLDVYFKKRSSKIITEYSNLIV